MSKSFVKLIDSAILPAAVMICGKVFGLWFANSIFQLDWKLNTDPSHIASIQLEYFTRNDQIIATSYSNLIMFSTVLIGVSFLIYQAVFLHSSHVSPNMVSHLAKFNLLHLVKDTFNVYYEAAIWVIFLWISVALIGLHVLLGSAYYWIFLVAFATSTYLSVILLRDAHHEIIISQYSAKHE